jgi:hypothetical protein
MAVNLVSPGVSIREVDLTKGGISAGLQNVGAIAGPFEKGPINQPTLIENEQQLLDIFGKPKVEDDQYEYWMSASNYLSYGGALRVIRNDVANNTAALRNSNVGVSITSVNLKITNSIDFENNHSGDTGWIFSAKNPGSWANNLKVCVIDSLADQIVSGINTTQINVSGFSTAATLTNVTVGITTTILSGVSTAGIAINMFVQSGSLANSVVSGLSAANGGTITFSTPSTNTGISTETIRIGVTTTNVVPRDIQVGYAVTQALSKTAVVGTSVTTIGGYLRGIVTEVGNGKISVKVTDRVENGISYPATYANPGNANSSINAFSFDTLRALDLTITNSTGSTSTRYSTSNLSITDWYDNQIIQLTNSQIFWKSIAPKPGTSQYASERSSKNDEVHIVVIDDTGSISGISGNILEKHLSLSKATDGRISPSQPIYYKDYVNNNSQYLYTAASEGGIGSDLVSSGTGSTTVTITSFTWGRVAQGSKFNCVGSKVYTLTGGTDYSGTNTIGGYSVTNGDVISSYELLTNQSEFDLNFLICGPSGGPTIYDAQSKANSLIAIAENRKDCVAVISPFKSGIVNVSNPTTQTTNIIEFFSPLTSSSYAVFDSGYKYTLDRFNNKFVYIPCNSDIAGLMARTSTNNYPWFSPAGSARGSLNNTIKLAYNPSQGQRDTLYTNRINPIIFSPGAGFILFGDKTALSYSSAFDRINVRMLFLTIEKSIEEAARAQLFEFNDAITRSNFINIVEPYLRDVRSKRGITEFLVVCDETNNTPDIIDSNQFKADIFVKPARSINFVGLTFVATRTGVSFSEVVGTV